jgi:hypothetical protein
VLLAAELAAEPVAVDEPVVLNRRAELVTRVLQVALERDQRDFESVEQIAEPDVPTGLDEHLNSMDALRSTHACTYQLALRVSDSESIGPCRRFRYERRPVLHGFALIEVARYLSL